MDYAEIVFVHDDGNGEWFAVEEWFAYHDCGGQHRAIWQLVGKKWKPILGNKFCDECGKPLPTADMIGELFRQR